MVGARSDWWRPQGGFFGDRYRQADDSLRSFFGGKAGLDRRTSTEVSGVLRLADLNPGSRLLDCPCGYGRHSIEFSKRGLEVVGADINPEFLQRARESRDALGLPGLVLEEQDMRSLPYEREFDCVANLFYSFGFFSDENDDLRTLRSFHRSLRKGGVFLLHTMITQPRLEDGSIPREEIRPLPGGGSLELFRELDKSSMREEGRWTLIDDEGTRTELRPYSVRIYDPDELVRICSDVGFRSVEVLGDEAQVPYESASELLIVRAVV